MEVSDESTLLPHLQPLNLRATRGRGCLGTVSDENVKIVRAVYDSFAAGDVDQVVAVASWSRRAFLRTFPDAVSGRASTNSQVVGVLYAARWLRQ